MSISVPMFLCSERKKVSEYEGITDSLTLLSVNVTLVKIPHLLSISFSCSRLLSAKGFQMKVSPSLSILYFMCLLYCDLCSRGSSLYPMVLIFIYFKLLPNHCS